MSTLIEKNTGQHPHMPHPWLAGSSHPFLAAAVHLQDNAPIAEIARLNYNSAFSCDLRSLPSPLTCCKQLPQAYKKVDEEEQQILRIKLKLI